MWRISACFAPGHTQCNTPPTHKHTHTPPSGSHMWGLIKRTQTALDRIGDTKQLHLRQLHFAFNYLVMAIDKWRHHKCVSHGPLKVQKTDIDDSHGLTRHSGIRFVFTLYSLFALLAECTRQIRISLSPPIWRHILASLAAEPELENSKKIRSTIASCLREIVANKQFAPRLNRYIYE